MAGNLESVNHPNKFPTAMSLVGNGVQGLGGRGLELSAKTNGARNLGCTSMD